MDEKDEYPSDIESDVESDAENVLELPPKSNFNPKKTDNIDDDDETVDSDIEQDDNDSDDDGDGDDDIDNNIDDNGDDDIDEEKIFKSVEKNQFSLNDRDDDEDTDDDQDDANYHPELDFHNYEEIENLTTIIRNENGTIVDPLHKTLPFLTKYEKTRILGERTHQINSGSKPFISVESDIIDGYLIALAELEQKKIPFIVKRPLPNGGCEYWKLKDLEIV